MDSQEIKKIKDQFANGLWPKFLNSIYIDGLRGINNQTVHFRFPVAAIVGENGTGKSTFLKAAACAYVGDSTKTYYLSDFFVTTHWDRITGVSLEYTVRQGDQVFPFKMGKKNRNWSYSSKRPKRNIYFLEISRTLPLDATTGYAKIAKLAVQEVSSDEINPEYRDRLSYILGRSYKKARFAVPDIDKSKKVGLLERADCREISQFHQGAGEDATLDLMRNLQSVPETSLIIIDEIEASLHPKAQRRLVRTLLWLCRQKRLQIILSTHSPYVLEELPPEARILLLPTADGMSIIYGASPEFSLSNLDENVHPEGYIYVEDRESQTLLREILASDREGKDLISRVKIIPVGAANVVRIMDRLSKENRLPYKSVAVTDGDQRFDGCLSLPGNESPEQVVFEGLKSANWPNMTERFGIEAGMLLTYFEDAMLDLDPHNWTEKVGNRVIKSKYAIWEILTNEWCKSSLNSTDRDVLVSGIAEAITPD